MVPIEENKVSQSALASANTRGYHAEFDYPKIFDDFLAYRFLTEDERTSFNEQMIKALRLFNLPGVSAFTDRPTALAWVMQTIAPTPLILGRSRYAEERLEEAVQQGVKQYVNLGAGMDTFAFRRPEMVRQLQVFEVDHPATQAFKRHRLAELGWEIPAQLHFVGVDFTKDTMAAVLTRSTYNPQVPTFFSWLGVTYYLSRNAVFATLRTIAEIAPAGSMIVFDYLDIDAFDPKKATPRVMGMLWSAQRVGEPMKSGFHPSSLATDLAGLGLYLNEDLSPWDIQSKYFTGRTDHYNACEHAHYACAVVK